MTPIHNRLLDGNSSSDESRWDTHSPFRLSSDRFYSLPILLFLFMHDTYSRPTDNTVYVIPKMALNRNASMIHPVIALHLLSGCIR